MTKEEYKRILRLSQKMQDLICKLHTQCAAVGITPELQLPEHKRWTLKNYPYEDENKASIRAFIILRALDEKYLGRLYQLSTTNNPIGNIGYHPTTELALVIKGMRQMILEISPMIFVDLKLILDSPDEDCGFNNAEKLIDTLERLYVILKDAKR